MDIALLILELVIALGLAYLFSQFKELPKQIHEYSMKEFEHDLSKKLEAFKKELTAELEEFKISRSELQIRKSEEFTKFIVSFLTFTTSLTCFLSPRRGHASARFPAGGRLSG
jgi:predicted PurR-regulated permease PerM